MKTVYIVRHCDKPDDDNDPCCSQKGCQRSAALVPFFNRLLTKSPRYLIGPGYQGISACKQRSQRAIQTLMPLSQFYNIPILNRYCTEQTQEQARDILCMNTSDTIIIVWDHDHIASLIGYLLNYADPIIIHDYPSHRFDIIFRITYIDGCSAKLDALLSNIFPDDPTTLPNEYQLFRPHNNVIFSPITLPCCDCRSQRGLIGYNSVTSTCQCTNS